MCLDNVTILTGLSEVITEIFGVDNITINRETVADDIPGWDSLSHTILMLTVAEKFKLKFEDTKSFENLGELADEIEKMSI